MRTKLQPGDLVHAEAGSTIVLTHLGLIPGVISLLALAGVVTTVLVVPFVVLTLAVALIAAPPYGAWRLITRTRQRGRREQPAAGVAVSPLPSPHAS